MKPRSSRSFALALLLAAAAIVFLNAWWAFQSVQILAANASWVAHSWQVVHQTERVVSSALNAETGERGYIITGNERYLDPYTAAHRNLPAELAELESLTKDNPGQQQRIREARATLDRRLLLLQQAIDRRRKDNTVKPETLLTSSGRLEMDRLRNIGDAIEAEEDRLLAIRTATTRLSTKRAKYAVALASSLDFLLIVFTFWQLFHERKLRLTAEVTGERLAAASKEAEARTEEVRSLNETLEDRVRVRTTELERINRELEAFSYSVSHDLRAPLRTIDGFSLALQEDYAGAIDAVGNDYIHRVRGAVQRMGQLIDALLQLSRITRAEVVREEFSMTGLANSISSELQEQNSGGPIFFHIQDGLSAFADPQLTRVALENLLGNAVKFSSKVTHPHIHFGWDKQQDAWYVRDNGAGFDMLYAEKLFGAFNRLHGDKDFKGSGIGLATVARVIQGHHGRIWAESAVDQGATFWFTLE